MTRLQCQSPLQVHAQDQKLPDSKSGGILLHPIALFTCTVRGPSLAASSELFLHAHTHTFMSSSGLQAKTSAQAAAGPRIHVKIAKLHVNWSRQRQNLQSKPPLDCFLQQVLTLLHAPTACSSTLPISTSCNKHARMDQRIDGCRDG